MNGEEIRDSREHACKDREAPVVGRLPTSDAIETSHRESSQGGSLEKPLYRVSDNARADGDRLAENG